MKTKIYCFVNGGSYGWYNICALSEDGTHLAGHISTNEWYGKHDIGITSDWKHEIYKEKYPEGYELEWIDYDDLDNHEGLKLAIERHNAMAAE